MSGVRSRNITEFNTVHFRRRSDLCIAHRALELELISTKRCNDKFVLVPVPVDASICNAVHSLQIVHSSFMTINHAVSSLTHYCSTLVNHFCAQFCRPPRHAMQ